MRKTTGPTKHGVMGRWAIFHGKTGGTRVQGVLTKADSDDFEMHRTALRVLYRRELGRDAAAVSDADTIAYLVRGVQKTRRHLQAMARAEYAQHGD